ncbi:hypothetical protein BDV93DRAFT_525050 [Ceratobasidium sp. AG-I]|nr:hypothetical protein BDV93DRAFT_525050 [Ceratobasidium sp. AG-I]
MPSLSRLCLLNRYYHLRLLQNLYRWVQLPCSKSASVFCQSICTSSRKPGKLVRTLKLCRHDWCNPPNNIGLAKLAFEIHLALSLMDGLQNLFLECSADVSNDILRRLNAPFRLSRFSAAWDFPQTLLSFLRTQPSIVEIHMRIPKPCPEHTVLNLFCRLFENQANLMPHLRNVVADFSILPCLIRSCPVTHVVLLLPAATESVSLWPLSEPPDVTLTSLHCSRCIDAWSKWLDVANTPDLASLCPPMKGLIKSERDTEAGPLSGADHQPRRIVESTTKFSSLERLEIMGEDLAKKRSDEVEQWLGDMRQIGPWQKYIRTLKKGMLYTVLNL